MQFTRCLSLMLVLLHVIECIFERAVQSVGRVVLLVVVQSVESRVFCTSTLID
jgi:hypothetical protein